MSLLVYLDLSTAHVSDATATLLDGFDRGLCTERLRELDWPAMTIAPYDCGWFISVPDIDHVDVQQFNSMPDDLRAVLTHAFEQGAMLVRFDRDADFIDGLPVYEW